jgi:hypothetical protein
MFLMLAPDSMLNVTRARYGGIARMTMEYVGTVYTVVVVVVVCFALSVTTIVTGTVLGPDPTTATPLPVVAVLLPLVGLGVLPGGEGVVGTDGSAVVAGDVESPDGVSVPLNWKETQ